MSSPAQVAVDSPGTTKVADKVVDFHEAVRRLKERSSATGLGREIAPDADASTALGDPMPEPTAVDETVVELRRLLLSSADEVFEDGMESALSRGLRELTEKHGSATVSALAKLHTAGQVKPALLSEALLWLGRTEEDYTREERFWFLVYCLREADSSIRSSAALGLASLEDHRAAQYLRREANAEPITLLRTRLKVLAEELE